MLNRLGEQLEHLDLTPRSPVVPGGRSVYGGILFLLYVIDIFFPFDVVYLIDFRYIPLLVVYLYNSIVPLYGMHRFKQGKNKKGTPQHFKP